jgi:integrase
MTTRRERGEGGLHWSESRQRWIATITIGFDVHGKRLTRRSSWKTKTEAKEALRKMVRELDEGTGTWSQVTVKDAVDGWLRDGLHGRSAATVKTCRHLCESHIVPGLGNRRLVDLRARDVDRWLDARRELSTSTLQRLLSTLRRVIRWAEARDLVGRNVAMVCTAPTGTGGRPSSSLTLAQAQAVMAAAEESHLHAYVVLALLTGVRTEELRALTWDRLDLLGDPGGSPPMPPSIQVWRSVRSGGDTKTRSSRRTLGLPNRAVGALEKERARQVEAGIWAESGFVFCTSSGSPLDAANVRRSFRSVCEKAGLEGTWTPRELRHSFVSLMSDAGVPLEAIARLVGHRSTAVTETVYRKQLRPVLTSGAEVMDTLF